MTDIKLCIVVRILNCRVQLVSWHSAITVNLQLQKDLFLGFHRITTDESGIGARLIPVHIRNPGSCPIHTSTVTHV